MLLKTSQYGLWLIEFFEGRRLRAYQDSKGIWTCGVGSTIGVTKDTVWTTAQVESALVDDLATAEEAVNGLGVPLSQPQFDALVSLTFNIGAHAFERSTAATELKKFQYRAAADAILLWEDHGLLIKRRQAEHGVFLYGTKPL